MHGMPEAAAIVVLTERGLVTARRIRSCLTGARIHGYAPRVPDTDVLFDEVRTELRKLYAEGVPIVGVCAAGILTRILAPSLADKREEPAVIAVAEDGSAVVPLLGGHRGANELGRRLGEALAAPVAITTASDTRWRVALDDPPAGWALANPHHYKSFMARLLAGEPCRLDGEAAWLERSGIAFQSDAALTVRVSDGPDTGAEDRLVFHPRRFALGVGCERGIPALELQDLVERTLAGADISTRSLAGVFSVDLKADEPAVHALGESLGLPVRFFDPSALEALTPRLANPSDAVFREVGCHGVSEAAALAAAGDLGILRVAKAKSRRATCAIGEAASPIDAVQCGRARGVLAVVGLGPGTPDWRTPAADRAILGATHLLGYRGYLDMVPASTGQVRQAYALGEETERADEALALAARGARVALVCSGDPGVYAMAALVFERLERAAQPSWRRSEIVVLPGVSAMHSAAALAGAPLGHDFCAISLSDLLTPWAVIEQRLRAAADGDFVVALYNPASNRRRRGLARAIDVLASKRRPDTPVVVARAVGRDEQSITVTCLRDLNQSSVDMMTLLIVGSTETRVCDGYVYTPRGYRAKRTSGECADDDRTPSPDSRTSDDRRSK